VVLFAPLDLGWAGLFERLRNSKPNDYLYRMEKPKRGGKREGAGRKGLGEGHKRYTVILNIEDVARIEGNRNEFIRQAVEEKLSRMKRIID
jgi:hypothetical protein